MERTGAIRCLLLLLLPAMLVGCTRIKVTGISDQPLPQLQHPSQVEVYQDIGDVPRSYQEIAVLEITSAVTKKRMLLDIQRRAAELGANGIILEKTGKHTELTQVFTGTVFVPISDERWDGRALAIRVQGERSQPVVVPSRDGQEKII